MDSDPTHMLMTSGGKGGSGFYFINTDTLTFHAGLKLANCVVTLAFSIESR